MKYVIDIDALKNCLELLPNPMVVDDRKTVYLESVFDMINSFPKDEVKKNEAVLR